MSMIVMVNGRQTVLIRTSWRLGAITGRVVWRLRLPGAFIMVGCGWELRRAMGGLVGRLDSSQRPRGANFGAAWWFGTVAAAIESAALAIVTNGLVFVTLLLTRPTGVAASLRTVAEIALSLFAVGIIGIAILAIL